MLRPEPTVYSLPLGPHICITSAYHQVFNGSDDQSAFAHVRHWFRVQLASHNDVALLCFSCSVCEHGYSQVARFTESLAFHVHQMHCATYYFPSRAFFIRARVGSDDLCGAVTQPA